MWQQVSKEQKEVHGMKEQSSDKKVPVFTISLHPGKQINECFSHMAPENGCQRSERRAEEGTVMIDPLITSSALAVSAVLWCSESIHTGLGGGKRGGSPSPVI